jgi:hypothetical protein
MITCKYKMMALNWEKYESKAWVQCGRGAHLASLLVGIHHTELNPIRTKYSHILRGTVFNKNVSFHPTSQSTAVLPNVVESCASLACRYLRVFCSRPQGALLPLESHSEFELGCPWHLGTNQEVGSQSGQWLLWCHRRWHHRNNFTSDDITETTLPVMTSQKQLHCWWHNKKNVTVDDITEITSPLMTSQKRLHRWQHHRKNFTINDITRKTSPVMTS